MIRFIEAADERNRIAREILETLTDWFEVEESRERYIADSTGQAFWASVDEDVVEGFLCLKETGKETMELAVMGVRKERHRRGIGRRLFAAAKDYAVALGLAFQIKDDILDYAGTEAVGKPLGADILEQKMTLPLLGAFANAGEEQEVRIRAKITDIESHQEEYRNEIVAFVKENNGLDYAVSRLNSYVEAAVGALAMFPDSEAKENLVELAHFTADRIM